jgi:GNAT superfamily N-acetyltransferase
MGLLDSALGWMQDPRRTQQLQGTGRAIQQGLLNIEQSDKRFQDLFDKAFGDPKSPFKVTDKKALSELTEMTQNGLLGMAEIGMLSKATKGLPVDASIKSIDDIFKKYPDVTIDASVGKKDINLSRIVVPKEMRNQGVGTQVMSDLSEYADNIGKRITLTPSSDFGGSVPKLKAFYKELGFVENKGKNKDFSTREAMYREPQPVDAKPSYPQQEALDTAQKNAALPIKEGGLGLPKDNTPEMRSQAMGFETPTYHGTNEDINIFNVEGKGKTSGAGAFLTSNPTAAETYVSSGGGGNILPLLLRKDDFLTANARGRNWADISTNELGAKVGKKRYTPEDLNLDKNSATSTDELGMIANELGLKGAEIRNVKDLGPNSHVMRAKEYLSERYGITPDETWSNVSGKQFDEAQKYMKQMYESQKGDIYAIQDPSLIRSRFAAFDPMRKNEADILAGVLPLGLLADEEQRKKLYELMPSLLGQ